MPISLDDVLKSIAIINAGAGAAGEIIALVRRQPDGTVKVIPTLDRAGRKYANVQRLVSDWKDENLGPDREP